MSDTDEVRLDKWLWAARFFKTRSLAQKAIDGGKVKADGARVKAGKVVHPGLVLVIRQGQDERTVTVRIASEKRGPAEAAHALFEESAESIAARLEATAQRKVAAQGQPRFEGKPDKRQRRQLEKLMRKQW
jgi:ribosome-associated heat shock protein Hsp15